MNNKIKLIYEGKAKKIFSHEDSKKVIIEFKDDATAFNALKKAQFKGKGELNCLITSKIFLFLSKNDIPTHFIGLRNNNSIIAHKIKIIPLEIVLRNKAYGSICKQTTLTPGTLLEEPLIDIYFKNDELNDPLLTKNRIRLLKIISNEDLEFIDTFFLEKLSVDQVVFSISTRASEKKIVELLAKRKFLVENPFYRGRGLGFKIGEGFN